MFFKRKRQIEALAFLLSELGAEIRKHAQQSELTELNMKIRTLEVRMTGLQKQLDKLKGVHGA